MDLFEILRYLPDYSVWGQSDYLYHALWGIVGGLVRITYSNATIALPARTEDGWKLNALGEFFVSAVMGLLANTNPVISVFAAIAAPGLIESVVHRVQGAFKKD